MTNTFKRRPIKQHKELLENAAYRGKAEKPIKVRKREQEEKDAQEQIDHYTYLSDGTDWLEGPLVENE